MKKIIFFLIIIIAFSACKEKDEIGLDVLPPSDKLGVSFTDTVTIETYCVREDSIPSGGTSSALLGTINDPVFGKTTAGFCTQFTLPTSNVSFQTPTLDSIVLSLAYAGYYGDTLNPLQIEVYKLTESLSPDSVYYSDRVIQTDGINLASGTIVPHPTDSVMVGSGKMTSHLRIKLDDSFGQMFLNASGTADLSNTTEFRKFFKGLKVIASSSVSGTGSVLYFDLLSKTDLSKLTVYYNDSLSYSFKITSDCARLNTFTHDYSSASSINSQLSSPSQGQTITYVQPMGGLRVKVNIPYIKNFNDLGSISINKAELIVTAESSNASNTTLSVPSKLSFVAIGDNGQNTYLTDWSVEGDAFFGGSLNSTTKQYSFNIARHIQDILLGKISNNGFYLMVSGSAVRANRLLLYGGSKSQPGRLRLKLTYTKIQ
ncbi:MAG: DUF4270 domain-containing protein [Bacteroidota bacterium]